MAEKNQRSDDRATQGEGNSRDTSMHDTQKNALEKDSTAISLADLPRHKTYGCISTSIGDLCIFCLNPGNQKNLHKSLGKDIKECLPDEYVKELSKYICYPKGSLLENQYEPTSVILTDNDVARLCPADLDAISKKYFENNKYLNKEQNGIIKNGIKISLKLKDTISPKGDTESWTEYLYRISVLEIEELRKQSGQYEQLIKSIVGSPFPNSLMEKITQTHLMGEHLIKTHEGLKAPCSDAAETVPFPILDHSRLQKIQDEKRLQPFNELGKQFDRLIEVSFESSKFMVQMNNTQSEIAAQLKSSSNSTKRWTIAVFVLGVLAIVPDAVDYFPILSNYLPNSSSSKDKIELQNLNKSINELPQKIESISLSLQQADQEHLKKTLEDHRKEMRKLKR